MTRNTLKLSCFILFIFILNEISNCSSESTENVRVFTVATEATDGYQRYLRSAKHYGIEVATLGFGKEWRGGNMLMTGGGYKINLLREAIEDFKDDNNSIILFTDSYDVVFTSGTTDILKKFKSLDAKIVFGAEHFCWPAADLEKEYPTVPPKESRFLNSGMFIGYARNVYEMLNTPLKDTDDDQLYYTKIFLDTDKREHLKIKLDTKSEIFQNLHGAIDDVKLDIHIETGAGTLQNVHSLTAPSLIHGNGPSKISLNAFANYLGGILENKKCKLCEENKIELEEKKLPIVSVALFAERPVPFYEEFLKKIYALNYPTKRINLFIHSLDKFHDKLSEKFIKDFGTEYRSAKLILSTDGIDERQARKLAVQLADQKKSDYLFSVENDAHIDYGELLRDLIEYNRSFIAPVISKTDDLWSNFWGAITDTGFYARSYDYVDILRGTIRGMWNVPYVANCYLVKREIFKKMNFDYETFDPDMSLCHNLRNEGVFMYVVNEQDYGHLINVDDFDHTLIRPDFYTLFSNRLDWEERYIHPEYIRQLLPNFTQNQPCPDVYRFKIGTDQFCEDMIAIMENFGKWSDGSNTDKRLEGGYEAVPTRDIHMNQVGLEKQWLKFLDLFVRPLQEAVFTGYFHNPPRSLMNFVVRYRPDEQPSLRPHHDSSTYTINIALNRAEVDYQGGGCHFLRYNCSVTDTKPGWMLMHPGRLTHFHEGLKVTDGTRYIMISFVDP